MLMNFCKLCCNFVHIQHILELTFYKSSNGFYSLPSVCINVIKCCACNEKGSLFPKC